MFLVEPILTSGIESLSILIFVGLKGLSLINEVELDMLSADGILCYK